MLLSGVGLAAVVVAGIVGQQVYQGQALRAVETGLAQLRAGGIDGATVAWAGQERSGDAVVLRDVTVAAPGGAVLAQAARSTVKPRVTGRVDMTATDVTVTPKSGGGRLHVADVLAENLAVSTVPAGQAVGPTRGWPRWTERRFGRLT